MASFGENRFTPKAPLTDEDQVNCLHRLMQQSVKKDEYSVPIIKLYLEQRDELL